MNGPGAIPDGDPNEGVYDADAYATAYNTAECEVWELDDPNVVDDSNPNGHEDE